ncbi:MAG TPA: hypothetical protein VF092_22190 [Longimicrobium sp.]
MGNLKKASAHRWTLLKEFIVWWGRGILISDKEFELAAKVGILLKVGLVELLNRASAALGVFGRYRRTGQIHRPPGFRLLAIAEFLYSAKTYHEIFEPTVADLQEEYAHAWAEERPWKARWVRLRGYWSVFSAAGVHGLASCAKTALSILKAVR